MNPSNTTWSTFRFYSGKQTVRTVSSTGSGNRPEHGTLLDLPLNQAIPALRARQRQQIKSNNATAMVTGQGAPIPKIRIRKIGSSYSLEKVEEADKDDDALKNLSKPCNQVSEEEQVERFPAESSDQSQNIAAGYQFPEYPKCSPDLAIRHLVDNGMPIETQIGQLKNLEDPRHRSHKWRCVIMFGHIKGTQFKNNSTFFSSLKN